MQPKNSGVDLCVYLRHFSHYLIICNLIGYAQIGLQENQIKRSLNFINSLFDSRELGIVIYWSINTENLRGRKKITGKREDSRWSLGKRLLSIFRRIKRGLGRSVVTLSTNASRKCWKVAGNVGQRVILLRIIMATNLFLSTTSMNLAPVSNCSTVRSFYIVFYTCTCVCLLIHIEWFI